MHRVLHRAILICSWLGATFGTAEPSSNSPASDSVSDVQQRPPPGGIVGDHIPTELPDAGFPGETPEESNAAWPSGTQPARLSAWPQTGVGTPNRTLHACSKKAVLRDVAEGWADVCLNLFWAKSRTQEYACKETCWADPRCAVWQFAEVLSQGQQCWLGAGTDCGSRNGGSTQIRVIAGQRLLHGKVRVLKNMFGQHVKNLFNLGPYQHADQEDAIERCKGWCYSLISCEYWQYGETGCWVDAPYLSTQRGMLPDRVVQYPLTTSGLDPRLTMIAGEYIQHYCPPAAENENWLPAVKTVPEEKQREDPDDSTLPLIWICMCIFLITLALFLAYMGSSPCRRRSRHSRDSRNDSSDDEGYGVSPDGSGYEKTGEDDMKPLINPSGFGEGVNPSGFGEGGGPRLESDSTVPARPGSGPGSNITPCAFQPGHQFPQANLQPNYGLSTTNPLAHVHPYGLLHPPVNAHSLPQMHPHQYVM